MRASRTIALVAGLSAALAFPTALRAQASAFVGAWKLVSYVTTDSSGAKRSPWAPKSPGLIAYFADGTMAAQLYDGRRAPLGQPVASASPETVRAALAGMASYFGTFTVDTSAKRVTHHVEGAYQPDWIGHDLVRSYRFVGANRLELTVVSNADGKAVTNGAVLTWERVRR